MKKTLLKLTVACALTLAMAPSAHAQLLAKDSFFTGGGSNYNTGSDAGQNPASTVGFAGGWGGGSSISSTPISYSGTANYGAPAGGGSLNMPNAQVRDARQLSNSVINAFTSTSAGTVYMSFEFQLPTIFSGGPVYQALELGDNNGGGLPGVGRFLQIGYSTFGDFGGTFTNFGVRVDNSGSFAANLGAGDTAAHLFVLKLTTGATDTLQVWEDPTSLAGSDPSGAPTATISGFTTTNNLDTISRNFLSVAQFSQGGNATGATFSDIRIGQTFADIVAVPEVPTSSLTLLGLGALVVVMVRRNKLASQI